MSPRTLLTILDLSQKRRHEDRVLASVETSLATQAARMSGEGFQAFIDMQSRRLEE